MGVKVGCQVCYVYVYGQMHWFEFLKPSGKRRKTLKTPKNEEKISVHISGADLGYLKGGVAEESF